MVTMVLWYTINLIYDVSLISQIMLKGVGERGGGAWPSSSINMFDREWPWENLDYKN